jgi:DNA mismatch repair ATPase MutS
MRVQGDAVQGDAVQGDAARGDAARGDAASAERELARLDRILGWFALRNSEWGHPPLNLLASWDIHCVLALERWQRDAGGRLRGWLEALGQVEALCSLAGAAHDNPDFIFPEWIEGPAAFVAEGLGHPLLAPSVRVDNDVSLSGPGHALLITGSNMSGKSTLLRAIGLASVLAMAGGPVCARRLRLAPMSVHTRLRVNDSLADGVSHFYAELERLRAMLAATRGSIPVLFAIDEILAGTNSVERGIGARWLLGELLRAGALGAVSTHDGQLCQLPDELMSRVERVHIRESFHEGALVFDYRLYPGPVQAGNALRLMRSMGLEVC